MLLVNIMGGGRDLIEAKGEGARAKHIHTVHPQRHLYSKTPSKFENGAWAVQVTLQVARSFFPINS